ncbi:MAG: hypothetical protein ACM31C_13980 [Acidobacteriota bacterium]
MISTRRGAWLWPIALVACYSPYQPVCGFVCGTGGTCPPDYGCASDNLCHLNGHANATCKDVPLEFDVASATAVSSVAVAITFSGVPNPQEAQDSASYDIPGLVLTGQSTVQGSTVTLATSAQSAMTYTVTVANVTRLADGQPLTIDTATFAGRPSFNVAGAMSVDNHTVAVMFDAPPDPSSGASLANYQIPGLTPTGTPVISGSTVTLTTDPQSAQPYTVIVQNVRRASDFEPLTNDLAQFTGRSAFDVAGAMSTGVTSLTVTFDAAPDPTQAMTAANYSATGLTLSAPALAGNTVTLTSTAQSAVTYTLDVAGVTRAADGEPLTVTSTTFTGSDHCADTTLDGDETDVDCGGSCTPCANGKMCLLNTDCQSNNCATNVCAP